MTESKLVLYQAATGAIELPVDVKGETIWATQAQIAQVFDVNVPAVSKHITNILNEDELDDSTVSKMEIVQQEGKRNVKRTVSLYSLDMIISVGYRVTSSKNATQFRKWATKTLKSYISDGFAINPTRIEYNRSQFDRAIEDLKLLSARTNQVGSNEVTDLALAFSKTWLSLDAYDKDELPKTGSLKYTVQISARELNSELKSLKRTLIEKGEATELFAAERIDGGLEALLGNVLQSFNGEDVYPTLEEKAAHLLYFVVKNHVFMDGNKRSGAYAFVWFLQKTKLLNLHEISPQALTAITLLVAESNPKDKEKMVGLVMLLLGVSHESRKV